MTVVFIHNTVFYRLFPSDVLISLGTRTQPFLNLLPDFSGSLVCWVVIDYGGNIKQYRLSGFGMPA